MKAVEIAKDIYWVGAVDWSVREFHGYETSRGTTYNAYLILDEKITLIDTVKAGFEEELKERISSIVDPAKIDYIVSSHVEPDHSGAIPAMARICRNAEIITSAPNGLKGLTARYGEQKYRAVKGGEELKIGKRTLHFVTTPMLHWPDSMVTYCPEEKILFSNDAFGQHFSSTGRFDDENDLPEVMYEAKKYYANILMPYGKQAHSALAALSQLDIKTIATGHGIIWRSHILAILAAYERWSAGEVEERAAVVFDSMWHSTEIMAKEIADAFAEIGVPAAFYDLKRNPMADIVADVFTAKYLAVGSPTLNNQMLPNVAKFLCYLKGLNPQNHEAFAFGSFGWGGQSIALVEDELKAMGMKICLEKIRVANVPTQETLNDIREKVKSIEQHKN